jgi:transcriptional regulator with XRE-family HTH domain
MDSLPSPSPAQRPPALTPEEIEAEIGENLRALRLSRNLDRAGLAERAGVSESALKRLEAGGGSTLGTLVRVARALGREDWFKSIAPVATISPLAMLRRSEPRQRAGRRKPIAVPFKKNTPTKG